MALHAIISPLFWTSPDMSSLFIGVQFELGLIAENNSTLVRKIPVRLRTAPLQMDLAVCNGEGQSNHSRSIVTFFPIRPWFIHSCQHRQVIASLLPKSCYLTPMLPLD
ncbi:hypothetical protein TNCV_3319691 [Trichonephila clavipes]|nr:hypothetical protein TNCV_3319691 [Trichonephila clavipes]